MEEQKKKNRVRLPLRAYLLYLLVVTFALTGVTFSRYVVSSDWGDGARVASIRQLTVTETGDVPADGGRWLLAPGVELTKNAVVTLESSEMACYVFLELETEGWQRTGTHSYAIQDGGGTALSAWGVDAAWQLLHGGTDSAVYYQIVPANTPFSAAVLRDSGRITVSADVTASRLRALADTGLRIDIQAAAVQYQGLDDGMDSTTRAEAAWSAVRAASRDNRGTRDGSQKQ